MKLTMRGSTRVTVLGALLAFGLGSPAPGDTAGRFELAGVMAQARWGSTTTVLRDGTVLVAGGVAPVEDLILTFATTELFEPRRGAFNAGGLMGQAREGHAAALLQDGRVLVVGGHDGTSESTLATAEVFDPATGAFSPVGSMTEPRYGATATRLPDGRVLVVAGYKTEGERVEALATAELFDPETGRFEPAGKLAGPRTAHLAVGLPDGRVAVVGGMDDEERPVREIEVYDPAAGLFARRGEMAAAGRVGGTATLLPGGRILLAGGAFVKDQSLVATDTLETYDPESGEATLTGRLAEPRLGHAAVLLEDGRVLIAGGAASLDGTPVRSAEVVDSASGQSSPTGSMTEARSDASAVRLPDGRALIIGGFTEGYDLLRTAEVYVP